MIARRSKRRRNPKAADVTRQSRVAVTLSPQSGFPMRPVTINDLRLAWSLLLLHSYRVNMRRSSSSVQIERLSIAQLSYYSFTFVAMSNKHD
ncbi:uncharacterized protein BO88DRAFT_16100 [Aspergillus vadensis CBS 113365]|uniref:Uncharacterized protein n=1 Tax=Aspergillus vadensis (strain CBS 113365 / IMI 142717 / IBT 24658) TaxID=1448311 RepID=A0A319BQ67_ASPVC|nr:hypothetical protein BO88DRAFT_16100 [Aspergillus vadensis CBS 113365]PYH74554.1 hypothetical protein BO88DRAFT_16100 [Aspergillus vadensis CBS 113365]